MFMTEKTRMDYLKEREKALRQEQEERRREANIQRLERELHPSTTQRIGRGLLKAGKRIEDHVNAPPPKRSKKKKGKRARSSGYGFGFNGFSL